MQRSDSNYIYLVKPDPATMFRELKEGKGIDRMVLTPLQFMRRTDYPRFARRYQKYRYVPFSYE